MAQKFPTSAQPHIVILGGGLAGMATACHMVDGGYSVTLIEKRPYLGGRAFSFTDRATGQEVDNGQHIFLGCCTQYIDFLKKLGTFKNSHLQSKLRIKVLSPGKKAGYLSSSRLPNPLHLLPSLLTYQHLGFKDKALVLYALARIALTDRKRPSLAQETFHQWLTEHHQTNRAINNFWNLIVKPSVNDHIKDVSASMAIMVFQEGLMKTKQGACLGYPRVGLSALMGDAAQRYIEKRGGRLLLGKAATNLKIKDEVVDGVELVSGQVVQGDIYVSALPFDALLSVLPPELHNTPSFDSITSLSTAPIVNVHLWYDRSVMSEDFTAFIDSPLEWVFNKNSIMGNTGASGQYLSISLSGAFAYVNQTKEELQRIFLDAMAEAFPKTSEAKLERILIVKQDNATFRCLPGTESLRPKAETSIENLLLAGDWTDTGWPSTMEGAVRSGLEASKAVSRRIRN